MTTYIDLYFLEEDKRITTIGQAAMTGKVVGFLIDTDPGKADRYIHKLLTRFPHLEVVEREDNVPIPNVVFIKVQLKKETSNEQPIAPIPTK